MTSLLNAATAWEAKRLSLAKVNGRCLIDSHALAAISTILVQELEGIGIQVPSADKNKIQPLVATLLLDERDQRRCLVGNISIDLSPVHVVGAVIAAAGLVSLALGETSLGTAEHAVTLAAAAHAAAAAVSRLSADERLIIESVLSLRHFRILTIVTLQDVVAALSEARLTPVVVSGILSRLRESGAVSWSGAEDSPIEIIKWF